jgi:hypothetical protein
MEQHKKQLKTNYEKSITYFIIVYVRVGIFTKPHH